SSLSCIFAIERLRCRASSPLGVFVVGRFCCSAPGCRCPRCRAFSLSGVFAGGHRLGRVSLLFGASLPVSSLLVVFVLGFFAFGFIAVAVFAVGRLCCRASSLFVSSFSMSSLPLSFFSGVYTVGVLVLDVFDVGIFAVRHLRRSASSLSGNFGVRRLRSPAS